jgi:putative transposase
MDALFSSDRDLAAILEDVGRLTVRLVMQQAIEAAVNEFLCRGRYERRGDDAPADSRNGWQQPVEVKTTMGAVELSRPKLRGTDEKFCSRLSGLSATRANALEALVISACVRGLSDRDVEAALREVLGDEAALSCSTVSRIRQHIQDEFAEFSSSDLSMHSLDHLFLDGSHFEMHDHSPSEPALCAWGGSDTDGRPQLVGLAAGSSESTDAWSDFLENLVQRPSRIAARRLRQCTRADRRYRPPLSALAPSALRDPRAAQWCRGGVQGRPGQFQVRLVRDLRPHQEIPRRGGDDRGRRRMDGFRAQWERAYPSAVACLVKEFESLAVHLPFSREHWKRCRPTNLIERTFGETRRRTKVIGRLPGERTCVARVFAVLDRQRRGWRGMTMTPREPRRLQDLRRELLDEQREPTAEETVTAGA